MTSNIRKHYLDNLKWIILLILIPYHTAMAWNVWGEPNYIFFEGNRAISSIVVFFSPYFMPLLFVLAGIGTKFALKKRTGKEYIAERVKRLLVPMLFGTIVLMPILCYIGDKFNYSYNVGFFRHYAVFFTKYTDLTGADGGFSFGQFWFLLYLFVISIVCLGVLMLVKKYSSGTQRSIPFLIVIALGLPLPLLSDLLSIGGKSLAEYTYLFLIGYFVFTDEKTISKTEKYRWLLFGIGTAASILNVYLFIWADQKYTTLNNITDYMSEWFMIIALIGMAKKYLNFNTKVSAYMKSRSFLFYIYHFVWVVLSQYLLYKLIGNQTWIIFAGTLLISYLLTFICCEITIRIPFLCFLTGTKHSPNK
ncbi:MAG: acyltransferase [Clostridia bacterium]|nr:acyltransferase [Clostridia bacterium]